MPDPISPQRPLGPPGWLLHPGVVGALLISAAGIAAGLSTSNPALVGTLIGGGAAAVALAAALYEHRRARDLRDAVRSVHDLGDPGRSANQTPGPRRPELDPLMDAAQALGMRTRAEVKAALKQNRNLEALLDAIDEPILATDNTERVLVCNRSAERLLSRRGTPLIGSDIREVFTQAAILDLHSAARSGETRRERVRVSTPLGQRVYQVTAAPVPVAWGEGVFGAVLALRDVTELDQAVQVQTDFVANASHELRTPVAAIRGAAETLQTAEDDPIMSTRLRGMILDNALRLEEMLRDLLDLSRLESPEVALELTPIDLDVIARDVAQMSESHCRERSLTLSIEIDPRVRHVRSDRKLVALILRNLVENATKFAHEGTTVRVVAAPAHSPAPHAPASDAAGPITVRLSVSDKGIGIPLAAQERVFDRYYQADPGGTGGRASHLKGWRRGTGLGLAIVKHAAQALGGKAALSSVWGEGTTVWVEFPAEAREAEGRVEVGKAG